MSIDQTLQKRQERQLCTKHDAFLIDNGDSEQYCTAASQIRTCQFETVIVIETETQ